MHSNPTTQHPGANFILKSFSASIKDSSLEGDNFFVVIDTQSIANDLGCFLDEKKIKFDCEDTQFLIDLSSIPESLVKPTKKKLVGSTKLEKFMDALRSEGATPIHFSKRTLLKGQVFVNTTNGNIKRVDFFDEHQASVLVPNLREMGFVIEKGECKDVRCFMVDLDKSLSDQIPSTEKVTETTPAEKVTVTEPIVAKNETTTIPVNETPNAEKKTLDPQEVSEALHNAGLKRKTFNYNEKNSIPNVKCDTRGYYMYSTEDRDAFFDFLKKNYPRVRIFKTGKFGVLIKADRKQRIAKKKKDGKTAVKKVTTVATLKTVEKPREEVKETNQTEVVTTNLHDDLKQLAQKHGLFPKVEQPAGVLIPDSLGDDIILPHGALIGTGAGGICISLVELRKVLKNK